MKQYIIIFLILVFFIVLNINESYSNVNYDSFVIYPIEVTTKNLKDYVNQNITGEIIYFCSNEKCYNIKEYDINISIKNFKRKYDKYYSNEELEVIDVKGYPITEIGVNNNL